MVDQGSVTKLIIRLKEGADDAAQEVWDRYVIRLIELARARLARTQRRMQDEEDVVAVAFENLWQGIKDRRFSKLDDRHDLWQILVMLTDRRAIDARRRAVGRRQKEVGESVLLAGESPRGLADIRDHEPTPEFAAETVDQLERWLNALQDETLRKVAIWKLEGYTHAEIAHELGCVERTVERKLGLIRERLSGELV